LGDDTLKGYTPFLVPRFLSMNIANIFGANHINKYVFIPLNHEQQFKLAQSLPWTNTFAKYIKGTKDKEKELYSLVELVRKAWANSSVKEEEVAEMLRRRIMPEEDLEVLLYRLGVEEKKIKKHMKFYKEKE